MVAPAGNAQPLALRSAVTVPFDQLVYALGNVLPLLPLSQELSAEEFGTVALGQTLVVGLTVLGRAFFATPLLATDLAISLQAPSARALTTRAAGAALTAAALLVAVSRAGVLPIPEAREMLLLCFGLVAAFPTEIRRMSFIRGGEPTLALVTDVVWLVVEVVTIGAAALIGIGAIGGALASWSIGAIAALTCASFLDRTRQSGATTATQPELDQILSLGGGFVAEAALLVARFQGYLLLLALVAGPATAGGVRFAFALVAPVNTLLSGWRTYTTGVFRSHQAHSFDKQIVTPPVAAAVLLVVVTAAVPPEIVDTLAGNADARAYLLFVAIAVAFSAVDVVIQAYFAAAGKTSSLWKARVLEVAAWLVPLGALGASGRGAVGPLIAAAGLLGTCGWVVSYVKVARSHPQ